MERKILYLINPASGTGDKKKTEELIATATQKEKLPFRIIPTNPDGNYDDAEELIRQEGFTDICICGGDGTINAVVHKLAHLPVRFGIIPIGSGNGLALSAGIPKNLPKALALFFSGNTRSIDAFTVNDAFACMLSGLGFDAAVAHQFAKEKNRGLSKYALLTAKTFFRSGSYPFRVRSNNFEFTTDAYLLCVSNSNQFGNHFTIAPKASLSDGLLDVVIAKKEAKPLLLYHLLLQLTSGEVKKVHDSLRSSIIYFQTNDLEIGNMNEAPLHIDGEACATKKVLHYRVLPHYFQLIC